jgi:hypothetical protein
VNLQQLSPNLAEFKELVTEYLTKKQEATTKDIADNIKGTKNRAVVENKLLRLYLLDELHMMKKGRVKIWKLNKVRVNSLKPVASTHLTVSKDAQHVKNFWIGLYNSTAGDYLYIGESQYDEGGWTAKGGVVLPIDLVNDYVFNILKVAMRSSEFRRQNPDQVKNIEDFARGLALEIGLSTAETVEEPVEMEASQVR